MNSIMIRSAVTVLAVCLLMTSSVLSAPHGSVLRAARNKRSLENLAPSPSLHMRLADRLLKRALDATYEALRDMGASDGDLKAVDQKRNYIRNCYFQAVSCY